MSRGTAALRPPPARARAALWHGARPGPMRRQQAILQPTSARITSRPHRCPTPRAALDLARKLRAHVRPDWMSVRVDVMRTVLRATFTQHPELGALLRGTAGSVLVEASPRDSFSGAGPNGIGANMLGVLLMELREDLLRPGRP